MTTNNATFHSIVLAILFLGFPAVASAQEKNSTNTDVVDLKVVWKKVIEVNQVWLDPRPESLSYEIVSGSPPPARPETRQSAWISGNKARWEMESGEGAKRLEYTLIISEEQSRYLRGPDALLKKPLMPRPLHTLRQAFTCQTAIHALYQHGLPNDAKVVSNTKEGDNQLVVIETTLAEQRSAFGLGLYHLHYGQVQRRIGHTKLTVRLPDHVPLLEELDDGTRIEYGPQFLKVVNGLAPASVQYVSKSPNGGSWILSAQFQIANGVWLLKSAQNLQNQVVIKEMSVRNISTLPIADEKVAIPEKD